MRRFVHRFALWAPPASAAFYGAALGVAATAAPINSDAKIFLNEQISMLRSMTGSEYFVYWLIGLILLWLALVLWSAVRAQATTTALPQPLFLVIREFIDRHFRIHHKKMTAVSKVTASLDMVVHRASQSERENATGWANGLTNISARKAACAFAGVLPSAFEQSPKSLAILDEIKAAANLGWIPTDDELEGRLMRYPNGRTLMWAKASGGPQFGPKDIADEAMLPVEYLRRHFSNKQWHLSWTEKTEND